MNSPPTAPSVGRSRGALLVVAGLAAVVIGLYGRSVGYGLVWDDPAWFAQGRGLPAWRLFAGLETFQFYRPLTLLAYRPFVDPSGRVDAVALHAAQIGLHLLATVLTWALFRRWTGRPRAAALAAFLFALFPFSQQAVAWAAPQQPAVTALVLGSLVAFERFRERGRRRWAASSLALYGAALFVQESAAAFWPLFVLREALGRRGGAGAARWPAAYGILAGTYLVVWAAVPRLGAVTGDGFDPRSAGFLAQAAAPLAARALAAAGVREAPGAGAPVAGVLAAVAAAWLAASALLWNCGRGRTVALATAWVGLALLPAWAGLGYDYVALGQRLVYPAAPGVALLWAALVDAALGAGPRARPGGAALGGLLVLHALTDVLAQDRLFAVGARHVAEAVAAQEGGGRVAFVNFPDRYALRPAPYPLGWWGLTLAPVGLGVGRDNLADFARATTGRSATTESWSVPAAGAAERAAWPYEVDLRGVVVDAAGLVRVAGHADRLMLSEYLADGTLRLVEAGALGDAPATRPDARLGGRVRLWVRGVAARPDASAEVQLGWSADGPLEAEETVFVHLFGPDGAQVAGDDGDAWGGLLPGAAWPPGRLVEDVRAVRPPGTPRPRDYRLTVGMYDRRSGARLAARAPDGTRFADDEVPVATFSVR